MEGGVRLTKKSKGVLDCVHFSSIMSFVSLDALAFRSVATYVTATNESLWTQSGVKILAEQNCFSDLSFSLHSRRAPIIIVCDY